MVEWMNFNVSFDAHDLSGFKPLPYLLASCFRLRVASVEVMRLSVGLLFQVVLFGQGGDLCLVRVT